MPAPEGPLGQAFSRAWSALAPLRTVHGATPQRDSAVIGLSVGTAIGEATQIHLRADGEIASGTDCQTLTAVPAPDLVAWCAGQAATSCPSHLAR